MELPKDRRLSHVSRTTAVKAPSERVFAVLEDPALLADLLPAGHSEEDLQLAQAALDIVQSLEPIGIAARVRSIT